MGQHHQDCEDFLGRGVDLQRLLQQLGAPRGGFVENLGKFGDLEEILIYW